MQKNRRITFQRVFCPTDLTTHSDEALRYALTLASTFESELVVCYCIDSPAKEESTLVLESKLNAAVSAFLRPPISPGFQWKSVVVSGNPETVLPREATNQLADLVVLRSRHRGRTATFIGSVAEALCRTSPCPVLVTHAKEREWVGKTMNDLDLKRILVAYDFSSDSELALAYGLSLAQEFQTTLDLMHVLPEGPGQRDPKTDQWSFTSEKEYQAASERLFSAIPAEAFTWCTIQPIVRFGHPYREILLYAEEHKVDLICMGVQGVEFGLKSLFGSNADRVLRQSLCPVLIARPLKHTRVNHSRELVELTA